MATSDYFAERAIQNEIRADKYAQRQARLITRWFGRAKRDMSEKILDFYRWYSDHEGITLQAAKKQLNNPKLLQSTLEEYYKLADQLGDTALKHQLDKISLARSISREKFLQLQLNMILDDTYVKYEEITAATLAKQYYEAYYKNMYDFQQYKGFGNSFNTLSINQIIAATSTNWSGKNYSERIWHQRQSLSRRVNRIITTGMITGKSNKQMRQELEKEVDTSTYNARRLIRTESAYVTGEARALGYEQNGTKQYQFIATLDLSTSEICRSLDNKVFDVDKKKTGVNYPPMHPNCRSTTAPYVPDTELDKEDTRAARGADGETYKVPADMSYPEWHEKYVASDPEAAYIEKSMQNIYGDEKQYDKYKALMGKDAPKSLDDMQRMKYTDSDGWEDLKEFARYKRKYPDSNKTYYNINKDIQKLREMGEVEKQIGIAIKPIPVKIQSYSSHALERMFERGFGTEDAQHSVDTAVVAFARFKNTRTSYYSEDGVTAILNSNGDMITGWTKPDHNYGTDKILEVVRKWTQ